MADPRPHLQSFATALKVAMARSGVGVSQLATAVGVSRAAVSAWRAGTSAPDLQRIGDIEQAVGAEHGELFAALGGDAPQEAPAGSAAASGDVSELAAMMADIQRELREQRQLIEDLKRDREDG